MKYFLHDTSAFSDEKVTLLYINFGYEGVGLYFSILEKLALQEKPIQEKVLKVQLKIGKKLQKQLNFMYKIDILSVNNDEVFSKTLLNFSKKYQIKKEKTRKRVSEWRENQKDTENVTCYEHVRNTSVTPVKKSKVKKSKVNKEKEENTFSDEIRNFTGELFNYFPKDLKLKVTKAQKKDWIDTVEKLLRIDKYSKDELRDIVKFSQKDDFWKSNVLSINSLRKKQKGDSVMKIQKIEASMKADKKEDFNLFDLKI